MTIAFFAKPRLRAYALSRKRPMRRDPAPLSLPLLVFKERLGWRLATTSKSDPTLVMAMRTQANALTELSEDDLMTLIDHHRFDLGAMSFALVHEVMRREIGFPLRDNQIECAAALLEGRCVELRTGEGKTYAAGMAALMAARMGANAHVITVNEYLASRDHDEIARIALRLRLRSAVITLKMGEDERQAAYDCDIVYGANKTFVFDHLRDKREAQSAPHKLPRQAGQIFAIVDEADSVLIDDATVPMILSEELDGLVPEDHALFLQLRDFAAHCTIGAEIDRDPWGNWRLTKAGVRALELAATGWTHPITRNHALIGLAERALTARLAFREGEAWLRGEEGIEMIDQSTGRLMPDRKWDYGMQQLVEITAELEPSPESRTVGQLTQQSYFRQYTLLAGLTGTAQECRGEFWAIYGLAVQKIEPHAASLLKDQGLEVFATASDKWSSLFAQASRLAAEGRAVLIGLNDVREAQHLAEHFRGSGLNCGVLDAMSEADEAALVAQAGQAGRITIATHLAGRGTDIAVSPEALATGGLHVIIGSAMASSRLTRQLYGRAGRKGQPGSYQQMVSLEDRILREGDRGTRRRFWLMLLHLGLAPSFALARLQALGDVQASLSRRRSLLREQKIVQQLGYR